MAFRRTMILGAAVLALGAVAPAASADPKGEVLSLTCGTATYEVAVNGNGDWSPAHDVNSTAVFIPTRFANFSGEVFDPAGNLFDSFNEPGEELKGRKPKRQATIDCTFTASFVSDGSDSEGPPAGYTVVFSGEVSGFVRADH